MNYLNHNIIDNKPIDENKIVMLVCYDDPRNKISLIIDYGVGENRHIHNVYYQPNIEFYRALVAQATSIFVQEEGLQDKDINQPSQQNFHIICSELL